QRSSPRSGRKSREEVESSTVQQVGYATPANFHKIRDGSCREASRHYSDVLRHAAATYGESFAFIRVAFPLETECNPLARIRQPHDAACEAAAAVRLARLECPGLEQAVVDWLWQHQSELTPDFVFDQLDVEFGLDVRRRYKELLPDIIKDATDAHRLNVNGTPTFFLNGRRLPLLEARAMTMAIAAEVRHIGRK
ncbi:MAG: DsbA family protein, partial [Vicinamibacterales bacterium]